MSVHSRAESIGPGGSSVLIQTSLSQVGWAAKQPGRTVWFMLFIEMSYKSPRRFTGFGWGLAEQGSKDDCFVAGWVLMNALCGDRLTYSSCKNEIICYTKHKFCEGYGRHEKEHLWDLSCGTSLDVGGEHIGPREDDYGACTV